VLIPPEILAGALILGINEGAYMAEIVRAGILSIDPGQQEAAKSLGMTYSQTMRRIVLPQAARVIVPPLGNEFNNMLKTTSLLMVLSVFELFNTFKIKIARPTRHSSTPRLCGLLPDPDHDLEPVRRESSAVARGTEGSDGARAGTDAPVGLRNNAGNQEATDGRAHVRSDPPARSAGGRRRTWRRCVDVNKWSAGCRAEGRQHPGEAAGDGRHYGLSAQVRRLSFDA
jgi:hypothetical protein